MGMVLYGDIPESIGDEVVGISVQDWLKVILSVWTGDELKACQSVGEGQKLTCSVFSSF